MEKKVDLTPLVEAWPSPYVCRNKIAEFSGGMVSAGSMAVFDSQGKGIESRFIVNRKTAYYTKDVVAWLEARVQ